MSIDGDHEASPQKGLQRQRGIGKVGARVGAEQHQSSDPAPTGRVHYPRRGETGTGRQGGAPLMLEPGSTSLETHAPRQDAGRQT